MPMSAVQELGPGLASLMSVAQLETAVLLYESIMTATEDRNSVSMCGQRSTAI